MSVSHLDAACTCESCGKPFRVELDPGIDVSKFADFETMVREEIISGNARTYVWGVRGKATLDRFDLPYQATIQGGLMLCDVCSKKCDQVEIEGDLTPEQVKEALGLLENF